MVENDEILLRNGIAKDLYVYVTYLTCLWHLLGTCAFSFQHLTNIYRLSSNSFD